ncbi:dTDP-4-dehydrorhamnose reductase [Marinobacterium marinum]|uniref:dTDP-4-dehydrorhamnose reductase n=1 Tax=Marinobacterium marinum TaxID=2756129 RepID=A0A7W1WWQ5_9GAMM|nr:dTDP-4-dehydrorhamnose reductase [Marinobacterium marinum]MBA4501532.1 dTDP-4-dehydrorhamnose reductase [Marinobacterium marinum]
MRVLITGARGQVGQELLRLAPESVEAVGVGSDELDITRLEAVQAAVEVRQPALIINAAAYTAVDKAESEPERAYAVNETGIRNLAQAAAAAGIPVLHISTDYVFDGMARQAYRETDTPCPASVYGASKLAGERALEATCPQHIIMRTSWVFGRFGHNFVKTMVRLARERDVLGVVADQSGGPTGAASIAAALWAMALQYQTQKTLPWGVYHFSGAPATTWHGFAAAIFEQAHRQGLIQAIPRLNAITTQDYPTPARRPANSVLSCERMMTVFGIAQPDWHVELEEMLGDA